MRQRLLLFLSLILFTTSCTDSIGYFEELFEAESYDKVIALYESNLDSYKSNPKVLGFVAKSYFQLKEYERALRLYEDAIELNRYEPMYHSDKGLLYYEIKDYTKAIISCDRAIEIAPEYGAAYINRSAVYIGMKKWDWAMEDLTTAKNMNLEEQEEGFIYANLSTIYANTNQYDKALESASLAIKLNEKILWAYKNRAFVYMVKNNAPKAINDIESGLRIDPNDPDLLMYKGMILIKIDQRKNEGCEYFKRAIDEFRRRNDGRLNDQISIFEKYCK